MVARGDFRNDSTVLRVDMGLRIQRMREQAELAVVEGDAGLVA